MGQQDGISRFDPATDRFTNYRPVPDNPASLANSVWVIYQDRSGTLWLGTWGGALIRFDDKTKTFVSYTPDSRDPHRLNGGGITSHPRRPDWNTVGGSVRRTVPVQPAKAERSPATRKARACPAAPFAAFRKIESGRLWLSTQKGISRFDPQSGNLSETTTCPTACRAMSSVTAVIKAADGEMFFGGSNGFNAFFPENIRDNPYVPPVVITSFKIFNKPVPIGAKSVLKKAIPYVDSLTLSYRDNVFSFEFAALSYANSHKNRYRYKLESFDPGWNEVGSKQRLATYTNLDPGRYVFRVQGSNSDGVWNEEGVSLPILITPPWWRTTGFAPSARRCFWRCCGRPTSSGCVSCSTRSTCAGGARRRADTNRPRATRHAAPELPRAAAAVPDGFVPAAGAPGRGERETGGAIEHAARAITEGRDAVQGLRASTLVRDDLARGDQDARRRARDGYERRPASAFRVAVEGQARDLHPILRDEIYKIAAEALRNAFRHAHAGRVEVEIRYDDERIPIARARRWQGDRSGGAREPRVSRDTTDCAACRNAPR